MTEETQKLFFAPWTVKHYVHACWEVDFEISTVDRMSVAVSPTEEHANRIARLPELYDALREAAGGKCWTCAGENTETMLDHPCPKGHDEDCYVAKWRELLRKVRDGE